MSPEILEGGDKTSQWLELKCKYAVEHDSLKVDDILAWAKHQHFQPSIQKIIRNSS